ncbi:ABC transporter ATP-binding protein [Cohnella panacarvi]|uniref:ABC transporter ATP-binding protein n=1 Tax=Cohnella panacarvi TaxID=400776 RepID=UPI00047E94EC|nr:ABC transporter ATP-binding protein [Cohnella panacarvi]
MAHLSLEQLTFAYPDAASPAISAVSLAVEPGEFVVLCGPSGSGKSTLLRLLKREVSPGGRVSGAIALGGVPLQDWPARELAAQVGLVMQHPDNQLVVDTVEHELAFGMENFGLPRDAMRRRLAEMSGFFGLEPLLGRRTDELSGGQKQLVNLAAAIMLQPRVLLLDEPLAQLDPLAARELLGMIKRLNDEWGITVIMSEHRVDDLLPIADRVVRMERGRIVYNGDSRTFAREAWRRRDEHWDAWLPSVTRWALEHNAGELGRPPLTVKEARAWIVSEQASVRASASSVTHLSGGDSGQRQRAGVPLTRGDSDQWQSTEILLSKGDSDQWQHAEIPLTKGDNGHKAAGTPPILRADELFFAYDKKSPAVLRGLDWRIERGDWVALFGGNGSGKSTLLQLLAGLRDPLRGSVRLEGAPLARLKPRARFAAIGYLAQNPLLHYAHETLLADLTAAAARAGAANADQAARDIAGRFGLAELLRRHPHDLSGGEQQLGALAMTLLGQPQLLLLDEPTKGLDPYLKAALGAHLADIHRQGTTLLMATHDVEFAAAYANRCALLFHGEIVADGEPEPFFQGNVFYAPPIHRLIAGNGTTRQAAEVTPR